VGAWRTLGARLTMPLHVDIDAHGRVVPQDEEARRLLADRAGRFVLLPSAPDLLLARRSPAVGGAVGRPRCLLAGDLSAFPIADLVAFLQQSKLSGLLTVSAAGHERVVAFRDGEVRGAQSDAAGEHLGDVAIRLGYLRAEQLPEPPPTERSFGSALVERGLLSAPDLWKCLHEQVATVFHAILLSEEGVFALVDEDAPALGASLSVNTQSLLMDGIQRIDEMSLFRARIPGPDTLLRRREPKIPVTLKPVEQQLLALVGAGRSVSEIARGAHLNDFDATKILYHLSEAGYVEAGPQAAPARARSEEERAGAVAAGMVEILREIALALGPGAVEPLLAAARGFLADPAGRFTAAWRGVAPARDGTVDGALVRANLDALPPEALAGLEPSRDRARILFDALHELVLFYLFLAGERLARADDERLGREVKRRFEALGELR
jgi:Domain of unknown function (DUF4388)